MYDKLCKNYIHHYRADLRNCPYCDKIAKFYYRQKNKSQIKAYLQQYYNKNCYMIKTNSQRIRNLKGQRIIKNAQLQHRFGITIEQYEEKVAIQDNKCAICKKPEAAKDQKSQLIKALAVDHCHKTGKIRGLLCQKCNHGLGNFLDKIEYLNEAISYLKLYETNN